MGRLRQALRSLAIAVGALCLTCAAFAQIDPAKEETEFLQGRDAYLRRDLLEAKARFEAMTKPGGERELRSPTRHADALMYRGATLLKLGDAKGADEQFRRLLLEAAARGVEYEPDPLSFEPQIVSEYYAARQRHRAEILAEKERKAREEQERKEREQKEKERQKRYLEALEKQAAEEIVITTNQRWLAFVPFGAGQFQNNQRTLGWTFLTAEAVLGLSVAITSGFYVANLGSYNATRAAPPCGFPRAEPCFANDLASAYYDRTVSWGYANLAVTLTFAAVMIAGVVQANLAFVPETRSTKPRALPQVSFGVGSALVRF